MLRTFAMTEKIVIAALALHWQGLALVAPEGLLLIAVVHHCKLALPNVSQAVFRVDKVVA